MFSDFSQGIGFSLCKLATSTVSFLNCRVALRLVPAKCLLVVLVSRENHPWIGAGILFNVRRETNWNHFIIPVSVDVELIVSWSASFKTFLLSPLPWANSCQILAITSPQRSTHQPMGQVQRFPLHPDHGDPGVDPSSTLGFPDHLPWRYPLVNKRSYMEYGHWNFPIETWWIFL